MQLGFSKMAGGGGEIRTHDTLTSMPVFKTGRFNHSRTPPIIKILSLLRTLVNPLGITILVKFLVIKKAACINRGKYL